MHPITCHNCGMSNATTAPREDGTPLCDPCWTAALRHGHRHGLHTDEDGATVAVADCPDCPDCAEDHTND